MFGNKRTPIRHSTGKEDSNKILKLLALNNQSKNSINRFKDINNDNNVESNKHLLEFNKNTDDDNSKSSNNNSINNNSANNTINSNLFNNELLKIGLSEYEELFPKILIIKKDNFMNILKEFIKIVLSQNKLTDKYTDESIDEVLNIISTQNYSQDYKDVKQLLKSITNINTHQKFGGTNYIPHCNNYTKPIHKCGDRFYDIKPYLLCLKCNNIYKYKSVLFHCSNCKVDYYSEVLDSNSENNDDEDGVKEDYKLVTWDKYHCNIMINDTMKCSKCKKSPLYMKITNNNYNINYIKKSKLICLNCHNEYKQNDFTWKCAICNQQFKSEAKIYNPQEFKIAKYIIKKILFNQVKSYPKMLPCCKLPFDKIKKLAFTHKKNCDGIIYEGEMNGKKVVLCSICQLLFYYDMFLWCCPICQTRFKLYDVSEYHDDNHIDNEEILNDNNNNNENKDNDDKENDKDSYKNRNKRQIPNNYNKSRINRNANHNHLFENYSKKHYSHTYLKTYNMEINLIDDNEKQNNEEDKNNYKKNDNENNYCGNDDGKNKNSKEKEVKENEEETKEENNNNNVYNYNNKKYRSGKNHILKITTDSPETQDKNNKFEIRRLGNKIICDSNNSRIKRNELCQTDVNLPTSDIIKNSNINPLSISQSKQCVKGILSKRKSYYTPTNIYIKSDARINTNKNRMENKNQLHIDLFQQNNNIINNNNNNNKPTCFTQIKNVYIESLEIDDNENNNNEEEESNDLDLKNKNLKKGSKSCRNYKKKSKDISPKINNDSDDNDNLHDNNKNNKFIKRENKNENKIIKKDVKINIYKNEPKNFENNNSNNNNNMNLKNVLNNNNDDDDVTSDNFKSPLPSFNLDEYKIIRLIGQGTFAKIYYCEKDNHKYALRKIILNNNKEAKAIINECAFIKSLSKNKLNLVNLYSLKIVKVDETTIIIYILMELALRDWEQEINIRRMKKKYYKEEELLIILKELVHTFAELQRINVSHRDIKAQNILIFNNYSYKITDFGEAKRILSQNDVEIKKQTIRGTEIYMSPILFYALNHKDSNNDFTVQHNVYKSDVYSLGLCFVLACTLTYQSLNSIRELTSNDLVKSTLNSYFKKGVYSNYLLDFIYKMIEINEEDRLDFIQLESYINYGYY